MEQVHIKFDAASVSNSPGSKQQSWWTVNEQLIHFKTWYVSDPAQHTVHTLDLLVSADDSSFGVSNAPTDDDTMEPGFTHATRR